MPTPQPARFPVPGPDSLTEDQKRLAQRIAGFSITPASAFRGPFALLARAPRLGEIFLDLGEHLRFSTGIDDRYLELAVITHAWFWNDAYEWSVHYRRALEKGLAPDVVEAIRTGRTPVFADPVEAAVYRFTRQLVETRAVDDATLGAVQDAFGEEGVASLTVFVGNYAMLSTVIAVAGLVPSTEGVPQMERAQGSGE